MMFVTKKVKTQTLGEYLISCRNRFGLTIEEVAKFSQVQPKFLVALEEGRYGDLPAAVYVKGFLKSLAQLYRVDEALLVEQFVGERQISANLQMATGGRKAPGIIFPRFIFSPRSLMVSVVALAGLLSLGYLYFQLSSLNRPPKLELFSPEQDGTVNVAQLLVRGRTEPGATVFLNSQELVADANGEFQENLSLGPGQNQLVIRAVNKFGKESFIKRSITFQEKEIAGSFTKDTPAEQPLVLEVEIGSTATWIYLEADGVEKYSGTMLSKSSQSIIAQSQIVLTSGNAGATRVIFNGKDLGVLGKEGEVIRDIEFTK